MCRLVGLAMIKVIIFDLWYTLAKKNLSVSGTLKRHFGIPHTKTFVKRYEKSIQLNKWKRHEDMAKNFLKHFHLPKTKENIAFFTEVHTRSIRKPKVFPGMRSVLRNLSKNHGLVLLTNTSIFDRAVPKRLGLDRYFDEIIFSWQIQSLKPSRKDWQIVTERMDVEPSECLLVDDEPVNVKEARRYGMRGIRFKTVPDLVQKLKKKKLL